jgi:quercetin dioxygenase-like cupin family protein
MKPGVAYAKLDAGGEGRFQKLRQELGVSTFGLNLLRLQAGERGRIHRHEEQEEVYLVLEGTLTLEVEGEPHELQRGELARVAPDVRRRLVNRHPEAVQLLAVGGAKEHFSRDGRAYESWDETGDGRRPQEVPLPGDVPVD